LLFPVAHLGDADDGDGHGWTMRDVSAQFNAEARVVLVSFRDTR
jgi:hypothetical protein